ncbi:MAG: hypothetical protein LQ349_007271, partial [Xanthoria aureola]
DLNLLSIFVKKDQPEGRCTVPATNKRTIIQPRVGLFPLAPALLSDPRYVPKADDLPNLPAPNVLPESTQPNIIETTVTVTVTTLDNEKIPAITITQDDVQKSSSTTATSKTIATADVYQSNSEASVTSIGTGANHVNRTAFLPTSSSTVAITTVPPPGAPTTCPSPAQTKLTTGTSTGVPIAAAFIGAVIWALRERRLRNRAESSRAQDPGGIEDDDTTEAGQGPNLTTSQRY